MRLEMDDEIDAVPVGEDENDALTEIDYKNDTRAHSGAGRVTAGLTIEAENLVLPKRPPLLLAGM
jgi:hypothetical protein